MDSNSIMLPLKAGPQLIRHHHHEVGLEIHQAHDDQQDNSQKYQKAISSGDQPVLLHLCWATLQTEHHQEVSSAISASVRLIAVSRTGKLTRPAKTPRAMASIQTTS